MSGESSAAKDNSQVEFVDSQGRTCYGVLEKHKNATDPGPYLTIQPEDGSPPTRVKPDSPEADKLRGLYPALKGLAERDVA